MATQRREDAKTHEELAEAGQFNSANPYQSPKVAASGEPPAERPALETSKAPHPVATLGIGSFAVGISLQMAYGFFTTYASVNRLRGLSEWFAMAVGTVGALCFSLLALASCWIVARLLIQWYQQR